MPQRTRAEAEEAKIVQLIVFGLGGEEFGVRIGDVREIIAAGAITPIPDSPAFIKGVINVRGEIVVAIDLRERFFLPSKTEAECKHIVIAREEKDLFGLIVDEVTEVLRIPEADIKETPNLVTKIHKEHVGGVVTLDSRLIVLLDLDKVLSEGELTRLSEIQREHGQEADKRVPEVESKKVEDVKDVAAEGAGKKGAGKEGK